MSRATSPDGGYLEYAVDGDGPALLLVSGLGGLGSFWSPHRAALARHFTVITYDHRGTGASSLERGGYSIARMARDALAVLDAAGVARAHLLGHSTGGAIGQQLAAHHPERVDRLVLGATWCTPDPYVRALFTLRAEILRRAGVETYAALGGLLAFPPRWTREHGPPDVARAARQIPDPEILLARIDALLAYDGRENLARITAPTLVLAARDDVVIPASLSEPLVRGIRGARVEVAEEGGHFFPLSRPRWFRETVLGFLAPQADAGAPHEAGKSVS